jgi:hypothetical protein
MEIEFAILSLFIGVEKINAEVKRDAHKYRVHDESLMDHMWEITHNWSDDDTWAQGTRRMPGRKRIMDAANRMVQVGWFELFREDGILLMRLAPEFLQALEANVIRRNFDFLHPNTRERATEIMMWGLSLLHTPEEAAAA